MNKVQLTGYIIVPQADLSRVLKELPNHIKLTQAEAGCESFSVLQDADDACRFDVNEVFVSQAAFEAHQSRIVGTEWADVTKNVERHYALQTLGTDHP